MSAIPRKPGVVKLYVDCVSPYSWFAFINYRRYRGLLKAHGVQIEVIPFFLGGARNGNGHPYTPPPPVKATWGDRDINIISELLGLKLQKPEVFPILSLYPIRVLTFIRYHFSQDILERSMIALWEAFWGKGINTSTPQGTTQALHQIFTEDDLKHVLEGALTKENKQRVLEVTNHVMNQGAFGAPWFTVINAKGETAQIWGNDRWDHVFHHLKIPYQPLTILAPPSTEKASKI